MVMKRKDFENRDRFPISNKESGPALNMITGSKRGRNLDFVEDYHQSHPTIKRAQQKNDSPDYGKGSSKTNSYNNVALLVKNKDRSSSQQTIYPTTLLEDQMYIYPIQSETLAHYLPKSVSATHLEKMKELTSPTVIKNGNSIYMLAHIPLPEGYATAYKNSIDGSKPTSVLHVIKVERVPKY